jgi:hypothetical protein
VARDYSAEYQARNARYKAEYGVSYNEYRRLASKAKEEGIKGEKVRGALGEFKSKGGDPKAQTEKLINDIGAAKEAYRQGSEIDFDYDYWSQYDVDDAWFHYH